MNDGRKSYVSRVRTLVQHYLGWVFLENDACCVLSGFETLLPV